MVLSEGEGIHRSSSGATRHDEYIEAVVSTFADLELDLQKRQAACSTSSRSSPAQQSSQQLFDETKRIPGELLGKLNALRVSPASRPSKSPRAGFKSVHLKTELML